MRLVGENKRYDVFPIKNLDSPFVQGMLDCIDNFDELNIKKLGRLIVHDIGYTKYNGIIITCKRVGEYYERRNALHKV
jgi:hypothetical protein